jgi:hypothetical protein
MKLILHFNPSSDRILHEKIIRSLCMYDHTEVGLEAVQTELGVQQQTNSKYHTETLSALIIYFLFYKLRYLHQIESHSYLYVHFEIACMIVYRPLKW